MDYCILIPTINRKDLLTEALRYYAENYPDVTLFIKDNGNQGIVKLNENTKIYENIIGEVGVAASWNFLIKNAITEGFKKFLVLNDDIILGRNQYELSALISTWGDFCIPRPFYNWSAFFLTENAYLKIGLFDENFKKAFFEDNDYAYRAKLAEIHIEYKDELNPKIYKNSQTILVNPLLGGYLENREYFIKKWGGLPNEEIYKTPFSNL